MLRIVGRWCGDRDMYARMAAVLAYSAAKWNPEATVDVRCTNPEPTTRYAGFVEKARSWSAAIQDAPRGSAVALLDVDCLVLGPLAPAFDHAFDVAVTERKARHSLNSGVVFVHVNPASKAFIGHWADQTAKRAGGRFSDQEALIECVSNAPDLIIRRLPCAIWNCGPEHWNGVSRAVIAHVKSDARQALFVGGKPVSPGARVVMALWREYEKAALAAKEPSHAST